LEAIRWWLKGTKWVFAKEPRGCLPTALFSWCDFAGTCAPYSARVEIVHDLHGTNAALLQTAACWSITQTALLQCWYNTRMSGTAPYCTVDATWVVWELEDPCTVPLDALLGLQ
jgi:hypothetical protein